MNLLRTSRFIAGVLVAFSLLVSTGSAMGASLDSSFGDDGTVVYDHGGTLENAFKTQNYSGHASALIEDRQGRILVAGGSGAEMFVQRYLTDGSLDLTFGINGSVRLPDLALSAIPDYEPDPADSAPSVTGIAVTRTGRITLSVVAINFFGSQTARAEQIVQLNEDGTLNQSFGDRAGGILGQTSTTPRSISLGSGGGFYISGESTGSSFTRKGIDHLGYISRRNADGSLNRKFGEINIQPGVRRFIPKKHPYYTSVAKVESVKGGALIGGYDSNRFFIGKIDGRGRFVKKFGSRNSPGRTILNFGGKKCRCVDSADFAIGPNKRIIQMGYSTFPSGSQTNIVLARYMPNGRLDRKFGRNGFAHATIRPITFGRTMAIQRNGRILVAAWKGGASTSKMMLLRFLPNGKLDRSFFGSGKYVDPIGSVSTADKIIIDSKGRAVVAGGAAFDGTGHFVLKRFNLGSR